MQIALCRSKPLMCIFSTPHNAKQSRSPGDAPIYWNTDMTVPDFNHANFWSKSMHTLSFISLNIGTCVNARTATSVYNSISVCASKQIAVSSLFCSVKTLYVFTISGPWTKHGNKLIYNNFVRGSASDLLWIYVWTKQTITILFSFY